MFNAHITIKELTQRTVNSNARFYRTIHATFNFTWYTLFNEFKLNTVKLLPILLWFWFYKIVNFRFWFWIYIAPFAILYKRRFVNKMSTSTSVLFLVYVLLACLNSRRAASHSLVNRELLYFRSCLRLLPGFKVVVVPNIVCVVLYNTSENCYMPVFKSTSLFVIHVV